jgi:hypothetical protein
MYYLWLLGGGSRLEEGRWEGKERECSGWPHRANGLEGVGNINVWAIEEGRSERLNRDSLQIG